MIKLSRLFARGLNRAAAQCGFPIRRPSSSHGAGELEQSPVVAYRENPEAGAKNLAVKKARVAAGGPFEWPNMLALNRTVASMIQDAKRIVELGGGTGAFAYQAARDPAVSVVCSESDVEASRWAAAHRSRANIRYVAGPVGLAEGPFDLVVAIDVIEHVGDYPAFLADCARLGPRALVTTPNRERSHRCPTAGPPAYAQHVREWSAGEFYWVLRCFYGEVRLFAMPEADVPKAVPIDVTARMTPLIADCRRPLAWTLRTASETAATWASPAGFGSCAKT